MSEEVRAILARVSEATQAATRREINSWLLGLPLSDEIYDSAVRKRLPGTCDWILDRKAYLDWVCSFSDSKARRARLLWIHGPAGFGKTVLCSRVVENLSSICHAPIGYFFLSADSRSRSDPYMAIRSWVAQLVARDHVAFEAAKHAWESEQDQEVSRGSVLKLFAGILRRSPDCIFVLDGLDECATNTGAASIVLDFLQDLDQALEDTEVRVMIVSRDAPEIRQALVHFSAAELIEYNISPEDVRTDNASYSQTIVDRKLPNKSLEIRSDISQRMATRCEGQFLWLKMQEEALSRGLNKRQLLKAIEETPTEIDRIYDRNWKIIAAFPARDMNRAFALLRLAAFALRPLTIAEMTEAVLIECEEPAEEAYEDFPVLELPDLIDDDYIDSRISELCAPLVEVRTNASDPSPAARTIHLTHFSVKEYLLRRLPLQGLETDRRLRPSSEQIHNAVLAKLCLDYLAFPAVWGTLPLLVEDIQFGASFRDYAASSWHQHVKSGVSTDQIDLSALVLSFLNKQHVAWDAWRAWYDAQGEREENKETAPDRSSEPLYYAVRLGLRTASMELIGDIEWNQDTRRTLGKAALDAACEGGDAAIVTAILDKDCDVNAKTGKGTTAIFLSCREGDAEITKLLLDRGAEPEIRDTKGVAPFDIACNGGHEALVRLLLESGVNPNTRSISGVTPLTLASHEGHVEIVKVLLDRRLDLDDRSDSNVTPLFAASLNGHISIVKMLLKRGANVASRSWDGWAPIHAASEEGHLEVLRLLVSRGADIDTANDSGITPLYLAARHGSLESVRLLQSLGADVSARRSNGWTPIHAAVEQGRNEVFQLLVDCGADISMTTESGTTPLFTASRKGRPEMVQTLLGRGADVEAAKDGGWTPLNVAAEQGHTDVAKILLDHGADLFKVNDFDMAPLYTASRSGHLETVEFLLTRGADIETANTAGWTPLNVAVEKGHVEVARLLLDHGADMERKNNENWSPLYTAARRGFLEIAGLLLDRDADSAASNTHRWTPLCVAAEQGHLEIVGLLLDRGADATLASSKGITPFWAAVKNGHADVVELLLERGVKAEPRELGGCDPLCMAATVGHADVVQLLLDRGNETIVSTHEGTLALVRAAPKDSKDLPLKCMRSVATPAFDKEAQLLGREAEAQHAGLPDANMDGQGPPQYGRTALLLAARGGHLSVVKKLLDNGAFSVDHRDWRGTTPLMASVRNGHVEVARMLLPHVGNDCFSSTDSFGRKLLWWAKKSGKDAMLHVLEEEAGSRSVYVGDEDVLPTADQVGSERVDAWCDSCTLDIIKGSKVYNCTVCSQGGLAICHECYELGIRCLGSHRLVVVNT